MEERSRTVPYLITVCVSVAFIALGAYSAWPTPVLLKFQQNETSVEIDKYGVATMLSMNPIGFIVGSFVTRYTADRLGRRVAVLSGAPPLAVGSLIAAFAFKGWLLYITMLMWSCGTGIITSVIGIYIAEIADKDVRGSLSTFTRFAFNLGNLIVIAVGPLLSYETLNYSLLPLPFVYLMACWWIPETPYYLLKEGRVDEARSVLNMLRRYRSDKAGEKELKEIQVGVKQQMTKSSSLRELFTGKQYRKAIVVAAGLKVTQIMTGGTTIKQYLGVIMTESQLDMKYEYTVFISFGVATSVVAMMSSILVDRMGRRPLLIGSYLGTSIALIFVGLYFFFLDVVRIDHESLAPYGFVPFAGIILSSIIAMFGFIAIAAVIPAEIFPINVKAGAISSLNVFGGVLGFVITKLYQHLKDWFGQCVVFWIFACVALSGAIFSFFVVPETGNKDLNYIQDELQGNDKAATVFDVAIDKNEEENNDTIELDELCANGSSELTKM